MAEHVVIVGAGHAGGTAAALLRQYGFEGPITLLGEETYPPYHRPPLSKAWLKGEAGEEDLELKGHDFYAEAKIDLRLNTRVAAIDIRARTVNVDGQSITYDILILATGARARSLPIPGAALPGVLYLRTADDAEALKQALTPGKRLAVIGGGYIGLEAAASARALGCEVAVLEREGSAAGPGGQPSVVGLLPRLSPVPRRRIRCRRLGGGHRGRGQGAGRPSGRDGRDIACDAVLVGVGSHTQ